MYGDTNKNGYGKLYYYYTCGSGRNNFKLNCQNRRIPSALLETKVLETLRGYLLSGPLISEITRLGRDYQELHSNARGQIFAHEMEMTSLEAKMEKLLAAVESSGHSPKLLERLRNLEVRHKELELLTQDLRQRPAPAPLSEAKVKTALRALEELLRQEPARARTVLRGLLKRVSVLRSGRQVTGKIEIYLPENVLSMMNLPSRRAIPTIWMIALAAWAAFVPP